MSVRAGLARGWYLLGTAAVVVPVAYVVAMGNLSPWTWDAEVALFIFGVAYALVVIRMQQVIPVLPSWYPALVTGTSIVLATAILVRAAPGSADILPLACAVYVTTVLGSILSGTATARLGPRLATVATLVGLSLVWSRSPAAAAGSVAPLLVWGGLQLGIGVLLDVTWRLGRSQVERKMERFTLLSDVAHRLAGTTTLAEVTTAVLEAYGATYPDINWGGVLMFDPASQTLASLPVGLSPEGVTSVPTGDAAFTIRPGEGLAGEAFALGRVVFRSTATEAKRDDQSRSGPQNDEIRKLVGKVMSSIAVPLRSGDGEVIGVVTLGSSRREYRWRGDDVIVAQGLADQAGVAIERGRLYEEQRIQASTDPLTSLPNRREFERVLAHRATDQAFTVLAFDLDHLKTINDEYGHEAGDEVLRQVGTALRAGLRGDDVLARVGGDEFAAFLPGADLVTASDIADRLTWSMHGVSVPFGTARVSTGCASGAAGADTRQVWSQADEALFRAKAAGRDRVVAAHGIAGQASTHRVRWAELLPEILSGHLIQAAYQPVVDLGDGRVVGFEALARSTTHPDSEGVEGLFTTALRMGLGRDLDWLCRRAAVQDAHRLPAQSLLFVNVGVPALLDPLHDVDQMLLLLRWADRSPSDVVLEITEREAVNDTARFRDVLGLYRAHGFRFALDDVGEGHSTLEILAAGQPEFIKIASSMTRAAAAPGPKAAIEALVTFARSSGAVVIAEGIETQADYDEVVALGATLGQGYLLAPPAIGGIHPSNVDVLPWSEASLSLDARL